MNSHSTRSLSFASRCAAVLLSLIPFLTAAKKTEERAPQITYDASSMDADVKTHEMRLKDVTITYGKMTVRADRALATAGDFKNSRWTFDGNVRINADPRGNLRSDEAIVEFEDNQLKRAIATGSPAEFDQKRNDSNIIARGHAEQIVYEVGAGTIRLTGGPPSNDAWVAQGGSEVRAPEITYDLRAEKVQASTSPGTERRVHVVIPAGEGPRADGAGANKNRPPPSDSSKPQTPPPQTSAPAPGAQQAPGAGPGIDP